MAAKLRRFRKILNTHPLFVEKTLHENFRKSMRVRTKWLVVNSHYSPPRKFALYSAPRNDWWWIRIIRHQEEIKQRRLQEEIIAEWDRVKLDWRKGKSASEFFLVGDEAFARKPCFMTPLPLRNMTNEYRLSRNTRVVGKAFDILSSRLAVPPYHPSAKPRKSHNNNCLQNFLCIRYPARGPCATRVEIPPESRNMNNLLKIWLDAGKYTGKAIWYQRLAISKFHRDTLSIVHCLKRKPISTLLIFMDSHFSIFSKVSFHS